MNVGPKGMQDKFLNFREICTICVGIIKTSGHGAVYITQIQVRWKNKIKIKYVIITQNMRPNNPHNNNQPKPSKNSPMPSFSGHTNSSKQLPAKSSKSIEKNTNKSPANNALKNLRLQQPELDPSSRQEYFNLNKDRVVKNAIYQKNDDYCAKVRSSDSGSKLDPLRPDNSKKDDMQKEIMHKLKFKTAKGVIGFDGKPVTIEPSVGRFTSQNRSLEQFTELFPKTEYSRTKNEKAKSKSHPKRSKNKDLPKSQRKNKDPKGVQAKQKIANIKQIQYSVQSEQLSCRNTIGKCEKLKPSSSKQQLYHKQPNTQPSTPHLYQFSQFYTQQFDLQMLKNMIKSETHCLVLNYLKRIAKQTRSNCIHFLSRVCSQTKLSKDIFFLAVELIDRYCNEQIMLNKFKILGIASLLLCVKFYDRHIGLYMNLGIFKHSATSLKLVRVEEVESEINIYRYSKKQAQKHRKEQNLAIIVSTLRKLHEILEEQLPTLPSSQEVMEFQTLILIKQDFRIHRNSLSYWLDLLTLHWDRYLYRKLPDTEYTSKCLFRLPDRPHNYYLLTQIVESCLHSLEIYCYKYPDLILAAIFLLCRISLATQHMPNISHTLAQYKTNLHKSNNLLFIDKYGINAIFGQFLQLVDMQIGDILGCCKFVSRFLSPHILEVIDSNKTRDILDANWGVIFYQHYYNPKLVNIRQDS